MAIQYYIAYGSNLHTKQMKARCPDSKLINTGLLKNYQLLFKGTYTGYATVVPKEGYDLPVAIYIVSDDDLKRLDRYEGVAKRVYSRDEIDLSEIEFNDTPLKGKAFIYTMIDKPAVEFLAPSMQYMHILWYAYREEHGFNIDYLYNALKDSIYNR